MGWFGAHLSVAGGFHHAVEEAIEYQCEALQIFSKNANQWKAKPILSEQAQAFVNAQAASPLRYITAHASYLINLASPADELFDKSITALIEELNRAEQLHLHSVVVHPGAHVDSGESQGIARIVAGLEQVFQRTTDNPVVLLLENTAGQGSTLGYTLEHLQQILSGIPQKFQSRIAVCIDTCHAFAAGYAIHTPEGYYQFFADFATRIGVDRLHCFHLNDSQKGLGQKVDRHEHIGKGQIGLDAFRMLVQDARFQEKPMILETPKESDEVDKMDPVNLQLLRDLAKPAESKIKSKSNKRR